MRPADSHIVGSHGQVITLVWRQPVCAHRSVIHICRIYLDHIPCLRHQAGHCHRISRRISYAFIPQVRERVTLTVNIKLCLCVTDIQRRYRIVRQALREGKPQSVSAGLQV